MAGTESDSRSPAYLRALVAALLATSIALLGAGTASGQGSPPAEAPNVVVVMSDDQDAVSLEVMSKTLRRIGAKGTTFVNSIATNPVCCPSRATFLTGRYSHSTGIFRNSPPHGGYSDFDGRETLPVWLQRAGYETALIGKYMNGYGFPSATEIPPGWSWWQGLTDPGTYRMYGYQINENGTPVDYGDYDVQDPALYQTDVLTRKAVEFIDGRAGTERPFFLAVTPLAPHTEVYARPDPGDDDTATPSSPNPRPAPRHFHAFDRLRLPRDPNFNERNVSDKPEMVRTRRPIGPVGRHHVTLRHRARMGSLLAVDDMVAAIVDALRRTGELESTYIVYTSDNGFQRGQHRIQFGKQMPYEESLRVPLLIRGPGIPRGATREQLVANVDLAPTIAGWTGLEPPPFPDGAARFDGVSLAPLIADRRRELGRGLAIENWCQTNESCFDPELPRFRGVRTDRFTYVSYPNGEEELYDLRRDPFQMRSRHRDRRWSANLRALRQLQRQLADCVGVDCLRTPRIKAGLLTRRDRLEGGRACTVGPVVVRLRGKQRGSGMELEGRIRGRTLLDDERPLRLRITPRMLKRRGSTQLNLRISALDGRVVAIRKRIPRPC